MPINSSYKKSRKKSIFIWKTVIFIYILFEILVFYENIKYNDKEVL